MTFSKEPVTPLFQESSHLIFEWTPLAIYVFQITLCNQRLFDELFSVENKESGFNKQNKIN